jgi:(p)ppGpp synthase/HD superfamily hydrolase
MNLQRAIEIAVEAHRNDVDKGGNPYILHPLRMMMQMHTDEERMVAVLHDVIEDHPDEWSFDRLEREEGFSEEVISGLQSVTKDASEHANKDDETYFAFVKRAAIHPIGRKVKIADISDNLDIRRLGDEITDNDVARMRRYKKALALLIG